MGVGTLGAGVQVATGVTSKSNVRGGFNYFSYSVDTTSSDNLMVNGTLRLASAEVLYDQFIAGGFRVSGGLLIWDGNQGTANVTVPGGNTLTLNGQQYYSATADPVHGTGSIESRKVAPEVLIGFGNLLPRSQRHFSVGFDLGAAFQGSANTKLNLAGTTCLTSPTTNCSTIASNSSVQANIAGEQKKIDNDLTPFKYYPIIRITFGYKF